MSKLTISVPESVHRFIEAQVASGAYPTAGDFVVALIREEEKRKARAKIDALLVEGLESDSKEMTRADWEELKRGVHDREAKKATK